jgi:hypothetical protein
MRRESKINFFFVSYVLFVVKKSDDNMEGVKNVKYKSGWQRLCQL